ncbi:unnamed protein product [Chrysoparadoxa australica]
MKASVLAVLSLICGTAFAGELRGGGEVDADGSQRRLHKSSTSGTGSSDGASCGMGGPKYGCEAQGRPLPTEENRACLVGPIQVPASYLEASGLCPGLQHVESGYAAALGFPALPTDALDDHRSNCGCGYDDVMFYDPTGSPFPSVTDHMLKEIKDVCCSNGAPIRATINHGAITTSCCFCVNQCNEVVHSRVNPATGACDQHCAGGDKVELGCDAVAV